MYALIILLIATNAHAKLPKLESLAPAIDNILAANADALDGQTAIEELFELETAPTDPRHPKDWVPWHAEFFMTDLAVSASGALGVLAAKGTPAVQLYWRKQNVASSSGTNPLPAATADSPSALSITAESSESDIAAQLEIAVNGAMATGRVRDESALRRNLGIAAREFQAVVSVLEKNSDHPWWISRFRTDVIVDASGKVVPWLAIGGELRLRFDWFRIIRKTPLPIATSLEGLEHLSARGREIRTNLEQFVRDTAEDLEAISTAPIADTGFKAHQFRVGVGITAKGEVGVAKVGASVIGHIYFSRDVRKPTVTPPSPKPPKPVSGSIAMIADEGELNGIIATGERMDKVVARVDRMKFRKGLNRALKMGGFFAQRAARSKSAYWKIFEMRTGFDLALNGSLGLATIGGLATTEICFYNESF